jgi:hypothetical protein
MIKNILLGGVAAVGVYMLVNVAKTGAFKTTAGEQITLSNKGGFIVDNKGRLWV